MITTDATETVTNTIGRGAEVDGLGEGDINGVNESAGSSARGAAARRAFLYPMHANRGLQRIPVRRKHLRRRLRADGPGGSPRNREAGQDRSHRPACRMPD